jgi:hypothetical protein
MRFRSRSIRRVRAPLLALALAATIAPASAVAVGDTPPYFPTVSGHASATPTPVVGDTPADYPGMPGAPKYEGPSTVEVVRPERTIVRDADEVLPIAVAALALLVALGGTAYVVVRTRSIPPARFGGSH